MHLFVYAWNPTLLAPIFPSPPFLQKWTLFMNEQAPDSSITGGRPINHVLLQHMLTRFWTLMSAGQIVEWYSHTL